MCGGCGVLAVVFLGLKKYATVLGFILLAARFGRL
jgi:hypothetical protein